MFGLNAVSLKSVLPVLLYVTLLPFGITSPVTATASTVPSVLSPTVTPDPNVPLATKLTCLPPAPAGNKSVRLLMSNPSS